jgi:hypothetical protein
MGMTLKGPLGRMMLPGAGRVVVVLSPAGPSLNHPYWGSYLLQLAATGVSCPMTGCGAFCARIWSVRPLPLCYPRSDLARFLT